MKVLFNVLLGLKDVINSCESNETKKNLEKIIENYELYLNNLTCQEMVSKLLNQDFWLNSLLPNTRYVRHDDCDGDLDQNLSVAFDEYGGAYLSHTNLLRFRTFGNGGMSLKTRRALIILAEAIRLDNEEKKQ